MATEGDAFAFVFGVEGGDGRVVRHLLCHEAQIVTGPPRDRTIRYLVTLRVSARDIPVASVGVWGVSSQEGREMVSWRGGQKQKAREEVRNSEL